MTLCGCSEVPVSLQCELTACKLRSRSVSLHTADMLSLGPSAAVHGRLLLPPLLAQPVGGAALFC